MWVPDSATLGLLRLKSVYVCTAVNLAQWWGFVLHIGTWPHKISWASNTESGAAGEWGPGGSGTERQSQGKGFPRSQQWLKMHHSVSLWTHTRAVTSYFVLLLKWCRLWIPWVASVMGRQCSLRGLCGISALWADIAWVSILWFKYLLKCSLILSDTNARVSLFIRVYIQMPLKEAECRLPSTILHNPTENCRHVCH